MEFDPTVLDVEDGHELIDLVRAEQQYSPALAMTVTVGAEVVVEAANADDTASDVIVEALFGPLDPPAYGMGLAVTAGSIGGGS